MSDIIATTQVQSIDSELIVLYDLEYATGSFAYFYPGGFKDYSADPQVKVEFRTSAGVAEEYIALPMDSEGFDISSDGAHSRPVLSVANIESVFLDALIGIDSYEDLIGKRITRRTTLKKYLVGESPDLSNPPVEFPKITYIIDRIKSKTILSVEFELTAPFDVAGVKLPRRVIIANTCPFKYKGAHDGIAHLSMSGGCTWRSQLTDSAAGAPKSLFVSKEDLYIVNDDITFTPWSSTLATITKGSYYSTVNTTVKIVDSKNNLITQGTAGWPSGLVIYDYWQALVTDTTAPTPTPSNNSIDWRRVRVYNEYNASTIYYGFNNSVHNAYILNSVGSGDNKVKTLWQINRTTQDASDHSTIQEGAYWTIGDICSKKLRSCANRFQAKTGSDILVTSLVQGTTYTISVEKAEDEDDDTNWTDIGAANSNIGTVFTKNNTTATGTGKAFITNSVNIFLNTQNILPFGGFPGSAVRR
jgi:lambda family phage minor tail protein L